MSDGVRLPGSLRYPFAISEVSSYPTGLMPFVVMEETTVVSQAIHQRCDRSREISSVESTPTAGMLAGSRRGKDGLAISCSEYGLSNAIRVPRSVTITGCCAA